MSGMRKQFVKTVERVLGEDSKSVLLLGDIGVFGFRKAFELYPDRAYNVGILEQATVSMAAGLAHTGFHPIVHTIAPFLVERSLEQLKDDFCYQQLGGNFVSVGASYDYAALGCTHHCPGDVGILKNLPGMEIIIPGTSSEFDRLFQQSFANGHPTYFRLSEKENSISFPVEFGKAEVIKKGKEATIIAVGPALQAVLEATRDLDVTLLYYTTVSPFDAQTLRENATSSRIIVCEPYYEGVLGRDISLALEGRSLSIHYVGVPHRFLTNYGHSEDHDQAIGVTATAIRTRVEKVISHEHH